jgi:hypothetical protein
MLANFLNECKTAGKSLAEGWDEKNPSSCEKLILKIMKRLFVHSAVTQFDTTNTPSEILQIPRVRYYKYPE